MTTIANMPAILGGDQAVTADHAKANHWPIISNEDEPSVNINLNFVELSDSIQKKIWIKS